MQPKCIDMNRWVIASAYDLQAFRSPPTRRRRLPPLLPLRLARRPGCRWDHRSSTVSIYLRRPLHPELSGGTTNFMFISLRLM